MQTYRNLPNLFTYLIVGVSFISFLLASIKMRFNISFLWFFLFTLVLLLSFYLNGFKEGSIFIVARFVSVFLLFCVVSQFVDIKKALYYAVLTLITFYLICYFVFDLMFPNFGLSIFHYYPERYDGSTTYAIYNIHFSFYIRWATNNTMFGLSLPRLSGFSNEPGI